MTPSQETTLLFLLIGLGLIYFVGAMCGGIC